MLQHSQNRRRLAVGDGVEIAVYLVGTGHRRGDRMPGRLVVRQRALERFDHEQFFHRPRGPHLYIARRRRNSTKIVILRRTLFSRKTYHFRGKVLEVPRETLVQPRVVPPRTRDQVTEPLVRELVLDHGRPANFHFRFRLIVQQHVVLPAHVTITTLKEKKVAMLIYYYTLRSGLIIMFLKIFLCTL